MKEHTTTSPLGRKIKMEWNVIKPLGPITNLAEIDRVEGQAK